MYKDMAIALPAVPDPAHGGQEVAPTRGRSLANVVVGFIIQTVKILLAFLGTKTLLSYRTTDILPVAPCMAAHGSRGQALVVGWPTSVAS